MLLKLLKMNNFRQYKGEQMVHFSCDPKKNVTIILGNNTFGKTTLLQAFSWCFYRHVNLDHPEELLNYDVQWDMGEGETEEVSVTVELMHGGYDYTITTHQSYTMANGQVTAAKPKTEVSYIDNSSEDKQSIPVKRTKVDEVISSILPEGLADYFFFDTERVESISSRKDLAEAVKGLLGLTPLDNAVKHIGFPSQKRTVLGKLYEQLDQDGDEKAAEAMKAIHAAQERIDQIEEELANCDSEIRVYETRRDQLNDQLKAGESTAKLQQRKEQLEERISQEEGLKASNSKSFRQYTGASSIHYYVIPLIEQAAKFLKDADLSDKGIKDLTKPTLEDIIENRDTCICGLRFADHPEAIEHIRREMQYCPPESIGNAVRHYKDEMAQFGLDAEAVSEQVETYWQNITGSKVRIQEYADERDSISNQIAGKENYGNLEVELQSVKKRLKDLHATHDRLVEERGKKQKEIEENRKTYDSHSMSTKKNDETRLLIRYAEEIKDWLATTYKTQELETRSALEERVNDLFGKMYHGRRRVTIDQKYQVHLLTEGFSEAKETGESGGLNSVKNFAFIAGLVSLAKDKMAAGSTAVGFDLGSESYPLVMDAPFSKADEIHTANISKVLPEASEQIVMFVMYKDWQHAEPVLADRVGSQYELNKLSEQHSVLKEL